MRDCFLPEGAVVDYEKCRPFRGIAKASSTSIADSAAAMAVIDIHHGQNPEIELTGPDTARGIWDVYYYGIDLDAHYRDPACGLLSRRIRPAGRPLVDRRDALFFAAPSSCPRSRPKAAPQSRR
ncbi:MAG: nuclear transport factor 2 family protein [Aliidongia sp.]